MDESWHEEVAHLKEQWKFPPQPITDPKELLRIFLAFKEQTERRIQQAKEDLRALEETRDRHVTDFSSLPKEQRDTHYERRVLKRDGDNIALGIEQVEDLEKDLEDWNERIGRLRQEVAEIEKKEKEALKRSKKSDSGPEMKRKKGESEVDRSKVTDIAEKLKDVRSITALRAIMDQCAELAKGDDAAEQMEGAHDESDLSLEDLPDGADVRGVSILEEVSHYSPEEKKKLMLSKYPFCRHIDPMHRCYVHPSTIGNSIISAKASHAAVNYIKAANAHLEIVKAHEKDVIERLKALEDKVDAIMADRNAEMILRDINILEELGIPFDNNTDINTFFGVERNVKRLTWYIMHLSGITDPPFDDVAYPRRILSLLVTPEYQNDHYWLGEVE